MERAPPPERLTPPPAPAIPQAMTRPGFAFSTTLRVRYAEIDGQKIVFNSRYLEYADVAATEFWDWTGIAAALGEAWTHTEFHVRHTEIDYLKPFVLGDTIEASVRKTGRCMIVHEATRTSGFGAELSAVGPSFGPGIPNGHDTYRQTKDRWPRWQGSTAARPSKLRWRRSTSSTARAR